MQVKKFGLVVTLGMIAVLMGCGGGTKTTTTPPPPTVTAITVTPATNVISTTGSATFKAEATYSDGTQADVSSTATWAASPAGIVTFSGSTATAAAKGAVTITATSGSKSGSAVLNVTNLTLGNGTLSGTYAFALQGIDTLGPVYTAGTITADGNGNITGGSMDSNSAANGVSSAMLTGTYSITADGRGQMTVTAVGSSTGTMFRFVISQDGTKGKVIEFDGTAAAAGTFEKQTAGALSGTYTFRLGGVEMDSALEYMGEVGVMTLPSSGTALNGFADANLTNGISYSSHTFNGTINSPTGGRGTMTFKLVNGTTVDFVYYVVSPSKLYMVSSDAGAGTELLSGQAEMQGTLGAFAGDYTFLLDHAATLTTGTFEKTGRMTLAAGLIGQGSEAEDLSSSTVQDQSFAFTSGGVYTDPSADPGAHGRGTIDAVVTIAGSPSNRNFVYYAVDSNKAYLLETPCPTCSAGAFRAAIGELQGGGSVALPVAGNFIFSSVELGELSLGGQNLQVGQLISDGNGNLSGIVDAVKHAGGSDAAATTVVVSSTALDSTLPSGLCSTTSCPFEYGFTPSNFAALAVQNYLVYVRPDGTGGVLLGYQPDIDGYIDQQ